MLPTITEIKLREEIGRNQIKVYTVDEGTKFTPSARQFLQERRINVIYKPLRNIDSPSCQGKTKEDGAKPENISANYICHTTGAVFEKKPEHMTHITGNRIVNKDHPRIVFRGMMDRFMAEILEVQCLAFEKGKEESVNELEEILLYVRKLLRSEVTGEMVEDVALLGFDESQLRERSHYPMKYFGVDHLKVSYTHGGVVLGLNRLRTMVRQVEISAVKAFATDNCVERTDILQALNRLSSCFYIMMLKIVSKA